MKAWMVNGHGTLIQEKELPTPLLARPGEALVRTQASGVSYTNVYGIDGHWDILTILPLIPGHEGVGVAGALGPDSTPGAAVVKVGDRVGIAWLHASCGACEYCNTSREIH